MYPLVTERLHLRPITVADSDRLAVFHADARVMNLLKHGVLTRAQSDAMVADYEAEWRALGFGSWTATERASGALERFLFRWNRSRFHLNRNARTGDADFDGHNPPSLFKLGGLCFSLQNRLGSVP